jgi:hypothetical protein
MGDVALVAVNETLGGSKPWVVASICSLALASGDVVPIPTWAATINGENKKTFRSCLHEIIR